MANYEVINMRERGEISPDGNVTKYYVIDFEIDQKYRGAITLPVLDFTQAKARSAIETKVREIVGLMKLKGEV